MKRNGSFSGNHPGTIKAVLKRQVVWLLLCAMLLTGFASACPGGTLKAQAEEAEEKKETLYLFTVEDLMALADLCHEDSYSRGMRVVLMNDLDLSGRDFTGIPIFNGTFQGQGYTVSGYSYPGDGYVTGFFRYVGEDGVVQNLKLDAGIVAGEKDRCTGALAGINQGRIMDCSVLGSVSGYQETGAICGINQESGIILRCRNKGRVIGYYYTGGIAGKNFGMISRCTNEGYINDSIKWIQEDDEMNSDLMSSLTGDVKETISLQSGVDTGGICGYSDGTLSYCTNNGVVGYAHAGYNIGGIVGRQSGFSTKCSNKGKVYGKKDVGGICGQLEPYIEVDPGRSMKSSAEKLNAQIDRAIADAQDASAEVRKQLTAMQAYTQSVLDTTSAMTDQASSYVEDATDKINETAGKVEKVVQTISENDPSTEEGQKKLEKEADDALDKLEKKAEEDTKKAVEEGKKAEQEAEKEAKEAEEKAKKAAADKEGTKKQAEKTATEYIKKADQAWKDNADKLKGDLQSASDTMAQMNTTANTYSEKLDKDITAIQDQVDNMNQMVTDLVQGVAEEGLEYVFADISEDAVDYTSRGILYDCANKGTVQGDSNGGGIVGSMDIDRENLENNVAITFRLQAGESYTLSVIAADCTNDGFVSGRSDNIGGIAGYMRFGLLERCYGYGLVESSGANVGGLSGYSRACIKDGYVLCSLRGTTNVGGVCGYGKTIRECISMPVFLQEDGTCGAIAGQVERDDNSQSFSTAKIRNNYYAANSLYGIDDISYEGVA
ncbi:MAG: hypothetical protein K6A92_11010, partial [Lachnospiraceae bacterium]|nr:hypothetical protein [Lachnospiraceae bacterium]